MTGHRFLPPGSTLLDQGAQPIVLVITRALRASGLGAVRVAARKPS